MSKNRKPTTKLSKGEVEISIVRLDDGREFRSSVKKMTRMQARNFGRTNTIEPGTHFTVEYVTVAAGDLFSAPLRTLGGTEGVYCAPGTPGFLD